MLTRESTLYKRRGKLESPKNPDHQKFIFRLKKNNNNNTVRNPKYK